ADGEPLVFGTQLAQLVDDIDVRYQETEDQLARLRTLTRRENEVLELMAEGRTAQEICEELDIAMGTARNHIHKALSKAGAPSQLEGGAMARRFGIIDSGQRSSRPRGRWGPPPRRRPPRSTS